MSMIQRLVNHLSKPHKDGSKSHFYLYGRLFPYLRPYLFRAIVAIIITIPIGALDGAIAYILKPYIDGMQVRQSIANVNYVPFMIVGFTLLQGLLNYLSIYLNGWLGMRVMNDLRLDLFKKLQMQDVSFFDGTTSGAIIQSYFRDPESLQSNTFNNAKQFLTRLSSSVFLAGVLIFTSWQLSIIAISVLLLILLPSTRIRKIIKSLTYTANSLSSDLLSFYTETVGGARVIYAYNLPTERAKKFKASQDSLFRQGMRCIKAQGWLTPSMHIIASVGIALIIWQGSQMVMREELTTGGFIAFIAAMLMLYNPIKNLGNSILTAQIAMSSAERVFGWMDKIPTIQSKPDAVPLTGFQQEIRFQDVSFAYNADKTVLKDINLTLRKGEMVALVGPSGSGKTTISNLIPRFYDVGSGAILIDGVDIRDFTLESLRDNIALVMQDNFLFDGTIRDNIGMGRPDASEADLQAAVEKAYLSELIASLPAGLDTRIGERGIMLSGGQRQRVAIARALLKNAPIVILDEATSALDNQSEVVVQKAIESLIVDRTVIVIAHRLSTIRNAHRIVVLEGGEIVESGTHQELLALNRAYAALYQMQFNKPSTPEDASAVPASEAVAATV